jgi:membrane associated rhomboid family serine protease
MIGNGRSFIDNIPSVTKHLIIINFLVWVAMLVIPGRFGIDIDRYLGLHYFTSPWFNPGQLFTYMFMHSTTDFGHLFFNMFGLLMFGSLLERVLGPGRYLFYYISAGLGAALIQEGVYAIWLNILSADIPNIGDVIAQGATALSNNMNFTDPVLAQINILVNVPTIGASGAIYGILLAFAMLFPNMPMYFIFFPVPIKAKWMVLGYGVIELFLGITGLQSGVAHFAHLGGMIVGFLIILYWRKKGIINGSIY